MGKDRQNKLEATCTLGEQMPVWCTCTCASFLRTSITLCVCLWLCVCARACTGDSWLMGAIISMPKTLSDEESLPGDRPRPINLRRSGHLPRSAPTCGPVWAAVFTGPAACPHRVSGKTDIFITGSRGTFKNTSEDDPLSLLHTNQGEI